MAALHALTCSDTQLLLAVPLDELPACERQAITDWLVAHDIAPGEVAVGHAIERDPFRAALVWRVDSPRGVERHTVYLPREAGSWPAPFPARLVAELAA